MNAIARNAFDQGKKDVERYFEFMKATVNAPPPTSESVADAERRIHLYKILKANTVLVLYNLIEATVTNSLIALYTEINASRLPFARLTEKLRTAWVRYEVKGLESGDPSQSSIYQRVGHVAKIVVDSVVIDFPVDSKAIPLSGNVDADKIRELAFTHGFDHQTATAGEGHKLGRVKTDRNRLAHGLTSFSECGRTYSVLELEEIKDQTLLYLDKVIDNIETFADRQEYLI